MSTSTPSPVAPDSVRVWRGFRSPTLSVADFYQKLGTVFIPATVKMQIDAGLRAYCPTALAGLPGKPDTVPDETAILFWPSQAGYWNAFSTLAVRAYTLTHGGVYAPGSGAAFPIAFNGALTFDQPVYLIPRPADWMRGTVRHFVGGRRAADSPEAFRDAVATALTQIQARVPLDGAIASVSRDAVVYWELASPTPGIQVPPTGAPLLAAVTEWKPPAGAFSCSPTSLPIGLWDTWSGMDVGLGSSFNMQFERALT